MQTSHYIIRGGLEGRERLRILSRVMRPTSIALLNRVGVEPGMRCLEVGCGSGDLAIDLARMTGPAGKVIGTDIDEVKLELARREAESCQLPNIEFQYSDIARDDLRPEFDLVHARFILTHLPNPILALTKMRQALRPGGVLIVEDIDFRGYFCYPDSPALWRYVELYTQTVRRRGGDADIGPRLPSLLTEAGFENVQMNVVQPAAMEGDVKILTPLTMESVADSVVQEGLATPAEIDQVVAELYAFANNPETVLSAPRIVEVWGYQS